MKRPYETVVVFDGTQNDDVLAREQGTIEEFLKKNAQFDKTLVWGKRQLAYEIRRKRLGCYCLFLYTGEGDVVSRLEASIRLNQNILRHLTVLHEDKARAAANGEGGHQ